MQSAQVILTILGIVVGIWTYMLIIRDRHDLPQATVEEKITRRRTAGWCRSRDARMIRVQRGGSIRRSRRARGPRIRSTSSLRFGAP